MTIRPDWRIRQSSLDLSAFRDVHIWPTATMESARNLVLDRKFIQLMGERDSGTRQNKQAFLSISYALHNAITEGRAFDMGYMPNAAIRHESLRALELMGLGHLGHPFREPYAFFHTWEGGACIYIVRPREGLPHPVAFEAAEWLVMKSSSTGPLLLLGDMIQVWLSKRESDNAWGVTGHVIPTALRELVNLPKKEGPEEWMLNVSDPIASCLLLLATEGVRVDRIEAPEKLNRVRLRSGKSAIPPYWRVDSKTYVTALRPAPTKQKAAEAGHHASPIPHLRRGHLRHKNERHGGGTVWVRDAIVNLRNPDDPVTRSFYQRIQE